LLVLYARVSKRNFYRDKASATKRMELNKF